MAKTRKTAVLPKKEKAEKLSSGKVEVKEKEPVTKQKLQAKTL